MHTGWCMIPWCVLDSIAYLHVLGLQRDKRIAGGRIGQCDVQNFRVAVARNAREGSAGCNTTRVINNIRAHGTSAGSISGGHGA